MEILSNCNYAVELGRKLNFVLVGIQGDDIKTGNKTLTLGLVWQLMRAYTLSLLSRLSQNGTPIVESEIITWANQRLEDAGKDCRVKHFQVRYSALNTQCEDFMIFLSLRFYVKSI